MTAPEPAHTPEAVVARALRTAPVLDGHNDLPVALRARAGGAVEGVDKSRPEYHTDLPRLREGGVGAQFWSVYVPSDLPEPEAAVATLEQLDLTHRLIAAYPDQLRLAVTADQAEAAVADGRIASLLGIEGGHSIASSLGVLRAYARLGVRYLTLTHNHNTPWAESATDAPAPGLDGAGLSAEGLAVVAELNRLGILVDLSHTAESTQRAALAASTAPVLFSHSSCRALNDHPRNVSDEVLALLRDNGGVVQLTFVPDFISPEVAAWRADLTAERARLGLPANPWTWPRHPAPGESARSAAEAAAHANAAAAAPPQPLRDWLAAHPRPEATAAQVADHVERARDVAGIDHIGLGGDYDGVDRQPHDLPDVAAYPVLLRELATRGWSTTDLAALTSRNVLRVLRDAEHHATTPLWAA